MSTLKNLLCCAVLLSPTTLVANTPLTVPVVVKIQVPNPGWKLQIDQVFNKGDEGLIVICSVKKNEGMHASVISEATDSVKIPANLTKIPLQVYVLGKDWNWGEGYTAIKKSDLKKITAGATAVYDSSQKKEVTKTDFIGLTLEVASKLAKDNKLTFRVIEVDGKSRPVTMDLRPDRLNFIIKEGVIISVTKG